MDVVYSGGLSKKGWLLNFKRKTTPYIYSTTDSEYFFTKYPEYDLQYLKTRYEATGYAEKIINVDANETIQIILSKEDELMSIISTNKQTKKTRLVAEYALTKRLLNMFNPLKL